MKRIVTLSYNHLSSHLEPCFLYPSIFPGDFEIQRRRLVDRWIAEGFVKARDVVNIEDAGNSLNRAVDIRGGDFELIPFGSGRRICPGMTLAIRMYKWSLPDEVQRNGIDMSEKFGVNVTKVVPLCAIATPI
ncbi:Cytochrome P450 76C2 [Panicum miliaceum]|uniref:Cytochrome P450 76C2 n=1 Tax=Panicum miliaceum TaxID=4540 RepID=A0A3L6S029_PANMI|nr:Cytochrome P450 76C2 [Panicum miliaceum]